MVYYLDQLKELYMYKFGPTKILAAILSVAVIGVLLLVYLVRLVL